MFRPSEMTTFDAPNGLVILSDLHINGPWFDGFSFEEPDTEGHLRKLETYLTKFLNHHKHVVLLGDVFDFYSALFPASLCFTHQQAWNDCYRRFQGFVNYLVERSQSPSDPSPKSPKIFIISGNHDALTLTSVINPLQDRLWKTLDFYVGYRKLHFEHGDIARLDVPVYADFVRYRIPPLLNYFITSMTYTDEYITNYSREVAAYLKTKYPMAVAGHTHIPCFVKYGDNRLYINTGMCATSATANYLQQMLPAKEGGSYDLPFGPPFDDEHPEPKVIVPRSTSDGDEITQAEFRERLERGCSFLTITLISDATISQECYINPL